MEQLFITHITRGGDRGQFFNAFPFFTHKEAEQHIEYTKEKWKDTDYPVQNSFISGYNLIDGKYEYDLPF